MKKDYRMLINNDTLEVIMKDKIIKLTLLDREGAGICSKILKEVYTPKVTEGYDTLQFELEPDCIDIIDSLYFHDMEIWGVKDTVNIGIDEPEYTQICNWYIDKKGV